MINFFGLNIHLYGLLVGLGIYAGAWVSAEIARREKIDPELVWDGLVWVVVFGLIGARAYHVVDLWSYYSLNLGEIVAVWNGGIGIYGGLLGGFIGLNVRIYSRFFSNQKENYKLPQYQSVRGGQITNYKKELFKLLDLAAFGVPVGQAIGRWGNYFNQELYGKPTDLPWGIFIDVQNRLVGYENEAIYQPLFLYESVLNLLLFGLLLIVYLGSKKNFVVSKQRNNYWLVGSGRFLGVYLLGYGLIRLFLEPLRIGNWIVGGVPMATIFSALMILIGCLLIFRQTKNEKRKN